MLGRRLSDCIAPKNSNESLKNGEWTIISVISLSKQPQDQDIKTRWLSADMSPPQEGHLHGPPSPDLLTAFVFAQPVSSHLLLPSQPALCSGYTPPEPLPHNSAPAHRPSLESPGTMSYFQKARLSLPVFNNFFYKKKVIFKSCFFSLYV